MIIWPSTSRSAAQSYWAARSLLPISIAVKDTRIAEVMHDFWTHPESWTDLNRIKHTKCTFIFSFPFLQVTLLPSPLHVVGYPASCARLCRSWKVGSNQEPNDSSKVEGARRGWTKNGKWQCYRHVIYSISWFLTPHFAGQSAHTWILFRMSRNCLHVCSTSQLEVNNFCFRTQLFQVPRRNFPSNASTASKNRSCGRVITKQPFFTLTLG